MRRGSKHSDELPASKVAVLPTNALSDEHVPPSPPTTVFAAKPSIAAWLCFQAQLLVYWNTIATPRARALNQRGSECSEPHHSPRQSRVQERRR